MNWAMIAGWLRRPARPHEPSRTRSMPKEYYGAFDVRRTEDGGRAYLLPHGIDYSVFFHLTKLHPMLVMATISLWIFLLYGRPYVAAAHWAYLTQIERLPLAAAILFIPVFGCACALLYLAFYTTDYRVTSIITIRENGMILDNKWFYPCAHIWNVSYYEQTEDRINWIVQIQLGVHTLRLAENLEEPAARLFAGLFASDIRRYWHRQNA